ncbi:AAA family ATPase, partial [Patescibacteria group bacterium]|nr:AAA family ATPase [Patescibacteria group bacterium]
ARPSFRVIGRNRVYVERAESKNGIILARHKPLVEIPIPAQETKTQEFKDLFLFLQEKFPRLFSLLLNEMLGNDQADEFFSLLYVQDAIQRLRRVDAENVVSVIDGIMNMLNHITFSNKKNEQISIYKQSLLILAEPVIMLRLGKTVGLLHELFKQCAELKNGKINEADAQQATNGLAERYEKKKNDICEEARNAIEKDLEKIKHAQHPAEVSVVYDHAEFLVDLPWGKYTEDPKNLSGVNQALDNGMYGLEKIKNRILEFLAVRQLNPAAKSRTLCFVGPPGVGKTALGELIANALNRKFISLSLGGLRDEAELRGHRSTYIGAAAGLILEHIKRANSANPVFVLDELDKVNRDYRGDPSAALLSILDPQQNNRFFDWYAKAPFDLSRVLFIATANILETILPALEDRLEIIEIPGYTPLQKLQIAKCHLINRRKKENGFPIIREGKSQIDVHFSDAAILKMVNDYTSEAGVRNLEEIIDRPFRNVARAVQSGDETISGIIEITEENLETYCGKLMFIQHKIPDVLPPGVVPILSVSDTGGHVMEVEVTKGYHPGGRKITMTGIRSAPQTKDVVNKIEESAKDGFDALMWVMKIIFEDVQKYEKKIGPILLTGHITDGAVPKDGPSAGVSITGAIYGAITGQSIKPTKEIPLLAATGEITKNMLLIRAIGGVRDKILAAHRRGVRRIIIPKENERDIADIPQEILNEVEIIPVQTIPEALHIMYPNDEKITHYFEKQRSS